MPRTLLVALAALAHSLVATGAPPSSPSPAAPGGLAGCPLTGAPGEAVCRSAACADAASDACWEAMDAHCEAHESDVGCRAVGLPGTPPTWACPFSGGPCTDPACEELTSDDCADAIAAWCAAHPEDAGCRG